MFGTTRSIAMSQAMDFSPIVPPADVADDAVGVPEPNRKWYSARVLPKAEKTSRDNLLKENIEAYAATQWQTRVWRNGRRKKIEQPVITQYIFVKVTEAERRRIVNYPYILSFLTNRAGTPNQYGRHPLSVVTDEEMRTLKEMLKGDQPVSLVGSDFTVGEKVSLDGWSEDIVGEIIHIKGKKNKCIGVRIPQLGYACIEVKPNMLRKIE